MAASDSGETNITVVVRLRPRNQKEIRENSPACIHTTTNRRELVVGDSITAKSYTFDRVFGPESTQNTIFNEVVSGMLNEVLMGFNCTIFAYGQTGTGKTYTMEGDLASEYSPDAGIIPRALYSLFDTLDSEKAEYSVRVSFVELYNEEIKDLLSSDEDKKGLKLFEDSSRKGSVIIQGLEEILVKSARDVISVLQLGSGRRQTAATKMNQVSSRSHGIFSVTVHTKENTPEGEELLKVGKLNLVDLAGSENIGRSGAENKRAKEAGVINTSLLTLGRVINALVERSQHIPYRESKLTRILRDSLGGRTKTCIIAAVSPAKCNIEESLSTLDYAHRAKNIRNKPEANQRMTKRALIREYINEIERLKADLAATREKNGIYLSQENYQSIVTENQSRKEMIDDMSRHMGAKEEQLAYLETQFNQKMSLLKETSEQLSTTMAELEQRKAELDTAMAEINAIQTRLVEQQFLTRAHAETEAHLDSVAGTLVTTLKSSVSDVEGLHDKLDRKRQLERENQNLFGELQEQICSQLDAITSHVGDFDAHFKLNNQAMLGTVDRAVATSHDVLEAERSALSNFAAQADALAAETSAAGTAIQQDARHASAELARAAETLCSDIRQQETTLAASLESLHARIKSVVGVQQQQMVRMVEGLGQRLEALSQNIEGLISSALEARDAEHQQIQQALSQQATGIRKRLTRIAAGGGAGVLQIARLDKRNQELEQEWRNEQQHLEHAKTALIQTLSSNITAFADSVSARQQSLIRSMQSHAVEDSATVQAVQQTAGEHGAAAATALRHIGEAASQGIAGAGRECGAVKEETAQLAQEIVAESEDATSDSRSATADVARTLLAYVTGVVGAQQAPAERILERAVAQQALLDKTAASRGEYVLQAAERLRAADAAGTEQLAHIRSQIQSQEAALGEMCGTVKQANGSLRANVELSHLRSDTPTGKTPRRRPIRFPTAWSRTRSHDDLLNEFRKRRHVDDADEHQQQHGMDDGFGGGMRSDLSLGLTAMADGSDSEASAGDAAAHMDVDAGGQHAAGGLVRAGSAGSEATLAGFSAAATAAATAAAASPVPVSKLPRSRPKRANVAFQE
ncbi:Kinesin-related motor protein [Polyrhizophydium stewartii]|uniref:Kinesin-related motor protein n=1 Tax=Polyrhizophydium stewartii TaxID=2732419 RepID=A0ABR4N161_9FUNG